MVVRYLFSLKTKLVLNYLFLKKNVLKHFFFFFKKVSFRITIRVSNCLDPDQAQQYVGPDLGPNCLQWLLTDNI